MAVWSDKTAKISGEAGSRAEARASGAEKI
jgi:hypothetical protein